MPLQVIPAAPKRTKPLVHIAVLTRDRPEMLARLLRQIDEMRHTSICDSTLSVWNNGAEKVSGQTHGVGHNVGQHISINRMIQDASDARADYFLRIDDDCVFVTKNALAKLVRLARRHEEIYKRTCVLSPYVHGLRFPPQSMADMHIGKYNCQIVSILGGICRLMPMSHLRYFRFDERMPMGWSEASTYAKYCIQTYMPMLRCLNIEVDHGDPDTEAHAGAETQLAYEREMLKYTPYGL